MNGDDALDAGMDLVLPNDDIRMAWDEINKTRDYAALMPNIARGFYVGPTTGYSDPVPGLVTIDHGLPSAPVYVGVLDRDQGGAARTRKVLWTYITSSQIQFLVVNNGVPLAGNPVEFTWMAIV